MKKFLILCLALGMILSLAGCYRANMLDKEALPPEEEQHPPVQEGLAFAEGLDAPSEKGAPDWGITLEAKDVAPTGMTLVIRQSGGSELTGEINTGTPYGLKMRDGDTWVDVPLLREDIAWNTIAYLVPMGGELEQNLNWLQLYGELEAGEYMLVKSFMDFRAAGDYDTFSFSVAFAVE